MRDTLRGLRTAIGRDEVRSISRRYFISNGFDGTLTSIGVSVGAFLSGVPDGATVIAVAVGAAVGLGTSGVWSVWEIERAEKRVERIDLEQAMLTDLEDTHIERAHSRARVVNAAMSGLGPVVAVLLTVTPYLLEGSVLTMLEATVLAVATGMAILFVFGAYLATIARMNWLAAGVRMSLAGLVTTALNILLPG